MDDDDYFIRRVVDITDMAVYGQAKLKYTNKNQQNSDDRTGLM